MNAERKKALKVLVVAIAFAFIYGRFIFAPLASQLDSDPSIHPVVAVVLMNLPQLFLSQVAGWLLYGRVKKESIALGVGLYLGWFYLDYYEPPFSVQPDGTINTSTLGWKGTSDTLMASIAQNYLGLSGPAVYAFAITYGAIIYLILAVIIGGWPIVKKLFNH